ncbi:MAG: carboxypeptidase regulatory-like domain-containing protein [Acidobacteriales bacterium]|nr:carboxypeptidase regulatory-like domain-containing protein [Terriglobales bacterium]
MSTRTLILLILILIVGPSGLSACECYNQIPIDRSVKNYNEKAVFTARVLQPIGAARTWNGIRFSQFALAIVKERFWGLPWYWPKVVILDGYYPCDQAVVIGEDYLVSGWRERYGMVRISGCSRTAPLARAQVDLRTIKGSRCSAPGGTVIGMLHAQPKDYLESLTPFPRETVTLTSPTGKHESTSTDADGFFEFRHLAPGKYSIGATFAQRKNSSMNTLLVETGQCVDGSLTVPPLEEKK